MGKRKPSRYTPLPHGKAACDAVQLDLVTLLTRKPKPKKRRANGIR